MDTNFFKLKFGTDYWLKIQLLDTPIVSIWKDAINRYQKYAIQNNKTDKLTVNRFGAFPPDDTPYLDQELDSVTYDRMVTCVNKINGYIEDVNKAIEGKKFPYRAYEYMPFSQTNLLHRCFTTAVATQSCWKHDLSHLELLKFKKDWYTTSVETFRNFDTPQDFKVLNFSAFDIALHGINEYIHQYEGFYNSNRNLRSSDEYETDYLFFQWDYYDDNFCIDKGAQMCIKEPVRNSYEEIEQSIYIDNIFDNDVFLGRSILGKDYPTAYVEYDDLLEWDITNLGNVDGSIHIHYSKNDLKAIYENSPFSKTCQEYGLEKAMYYPIPLGRIVDINFDLTDIKWPYFGQYTKYSSGFPAALSPFNYASLEFYSKVVGKLI